MSLVSFGPAPKFQMFCDGEEAIFRIPGQGYIQIDNPFLNQMEVRYECNPIEISTITGGYGFREYARGPQFVDFTFSLRGHKYYYTLAEVDLIQQSVLSKMSIMEMMKTIDQKVQERG